MAELPFKVKAVYSYDSPHEDDLNFPTGQIITVTEEEDNDWYYGEYVDESGLTKQGIFPRNFVERLQPDAPPRPMKSHRARKTVDLDASTIQESSKPDKSQEEHPPPDEPSPQTGMSVLGRQISHRAPTDTEQGPASLSQPQPLSRANTDGPSKPESSHSPTQAPSIPSKAVPSPPVDKPIAGSFRDRIAAFNKPAAPPITPLKPASLGQGGASFVKKPYVPPPPSRHAYIPPPRETPQKKYRREEEDIEAEAPTWSQVQTAEITSQAQDGAAQEKPTSLKERIALLQQQQLENAVRRSEAAQKGDAGRRPSKQRTDSFRDEDITEPGSSKVESSRGVELGDDSSAVEAAPGASLTGPTIEPKASHAASNVGAHDFTSDANDADQSGFDEIAEDAEGNSTEQDDTNDRAIAGTAPYRSLVHPAPAPPDTETSEEQSRHENGDGDQEDEDVDIDPEIRRRMELRERMAKMSGGMGMHGMFGMPGGIPRTPLGGGSKKEREKAGGTSGERESVEGSRTERDDRGGPAPQGQPIPALPPLPRSQSFGVKERTSASPVEIGRETLVHERPSHDDHIEAGRGLSTQTESSEQPAPGIPDYRAPHSVEPSDDDDMSPQSHPSASLRSDEAAVVEPSAALSPSAGSESDDEMSLHSRIPEPAQPPSIPPRHRPALPQSVSAAIIEPRFKQTTPTSPVNASSHDKRSSQASDAGSPNSGTLPVRERPPPPPPPTEPARPRMVAGDARPPRHPKLTDLNASEGEVTEYDGDYDTDITSSATHKAALSVSTQEQGDDSSNLSGNIAASITNITRPKMAPPIPRLPAPRARRQSISNDTDQPKSPSTDMPRGAPPPIPAAPRHESRPVPTDDYDPYRYPPPVKATPATHVSSYASLSPRLSHERGSDEENLPGSPHLEEKLTPPPRSSQDRMAIPLVPPKVQAFQVIQPHHLSEPMATSPRPSQEVSRPQSSTRRSMDQSRASADQGHIARDIDLGRSSLWWAQPNKPPPAFQNRADLSYEVEESRVSRRGGKTTIARDVYVLFPDYSQTIVTARSDSGAAEDVSLEQRHEPPPARLRQEQFEESQVQFGRRLADDVKAKQNAVVGDGTPQSLVTELLKPLSGALMPVGTRAYGAMIYLNLANASIQQHDEIRPGDVISFRNARFQGHKGTMHQKYSVDVGKPDHVGIVMDWDGTKKKVRAWEQGREGKKVKLESFRLGDLRSGEVKVWRVVGRSWVGWESQT